MAATLELELKPATLDDLMRVDGKAELIAGRIINMMPVGDFPNEVAFNIAILLREHVKSTGRGHARTDAIAYAVPRLASGRQSFSPDASYYEGPLPENRMRFVPGPPRFAGEVRSENSHGPLAEMEQRNKRIDYFEAGTLVVWDVDPLAKKIHCYEHSNPDRPRVFATGQIADAEPAVSGWRVSVDEIFEAL